MTTPMPTTDSTQNHLDIVDVVQDLVVLRDGSACMILEVSALNFGLMSEKEQDATIYAYAQLLNSLTFSIQIVITSKQKDISDYLHYVDGRWEKIESPLLKGQLGKYREFVKQIVRQGNVLDKKFYVAIPFSALELGIAPAFGSLLNLGRPQARPTMPQDEIVSRAITSLAPKRDHLVRLFTRIGLRTRQIFSGELIQLFFDFYNREQVGTRVSL